MYSPELAMALAYRRRRHASNNVHRHSNTDSERHNACSGFGRTTCKSSSSGFDDDAKILQLLPAAVKYLDMVKLELSVTKKHADVRYVMTVRHKELHVAWRHARSFDEYRKLQQRLLKKLQHGHFCDADCPWLYGFLKSYFPKKMVFTFSTARVVEQRKETLEKFFAALYGFLMERKNFCCSVVMTAFADELVKFIYRDALQQYGLESPAMSNVLEMDVLRTSAECSSMKGEEPATPVKLHLLGRTSEQQQQSDIQSSLTSSFRDSTTDDDSVKDLNSMNCGICGSPLCGTACGSSRSSSNLTASLLEEEDENNNSNRSISSAGTSVHSSSNSSNNNSGKFTLGGTLANGSGGSSNKQGAPPRRRSSASRLRAATYYLTTLNCGHQFHDECIVPKLNEALKCPTCGRKQTNS